MKKLKSMLVTLAMLLCTISASAEDFSVDGIYYKITDSEKLTVAVTYRGSRYNYYYDEYSGDVVIPETVTYESKTYSVTSIYDYAFRECSDVTLVNIPNSVTSIGDYAFRECINLTSVTIPDNVTNIGACAFYDCSKLSSIYIPNTLMNIGGGAFYGTAWYDNQPNGVVYAGKIAYGFKGTYTSIEIKDGTLGISESAFSGCSTLISVKIPNSVCNISKFAFNSCSSLASVSIPNSVTSIGDYAFYNCSSLTSVTIPNNIKTIEFATFQNCKKLTSVNIPNSVINIDQDAFSNCSNLASVSIPNSVTSIGKNAFYKCTSLTSVTIPNSVTSIGNEAFYNCSSLTSVSLSNSITSIGSRTFNGCSSLTSITIPYGVTSIGSSAFSLCRGLTTVTIPSSVEIIGHAAFAHCSSLASITLPPSVKSIDQYAFSACSILESIKVLAETPPSLYENAFDTYDIKLIVNASSIELYKNYSPWSNFTSIIPVDEDIVPSCKINITNSISTFCSNSDLDFTNVSGLKAYIASGYNNNTGKVMLSRIYDVPAGTGLLLIGETGNYEVPITTSASCYSNFLKGVTTATTITPTSDGYNNYILANGTNGIGFYPVGDEGTLASGKAYLQLPSSVSSAKGFSLSFEDETTGISDNYEVEIMNSDDAVYDLQGRKVKNPTKGLYIINGKKVVIK